MVDAAADLGDTSRPIFAFARVQRRLAPTDRQRAESIGDYLASQFVFVSDCRYRLLNAHCFGIIALRRASPAGLEHHVGTLHAGDQVQRLVIGTLGEEDLRPALLVGQRQFLTVQRPSSSDLHEF